MSSTTVDNESGSGADDAHNDTFESQTDLDILQDASATHFIEAFPIEDQQGSAHEEGRH